MAKDISTPVGTFRYVYVTKKDNYDKYKVCWYPKSEADRKAVLAKLKEVSDECFAAANKPSWGHYASKEKTDKDGVKYFQFDSTNRPPRVVDANVNNIPKEVAGKIGNGSEGKCYIGYMATTHDSGKKAGAKFFLNTVQVTKLVEFDAETAGVERVEGGYSVDVSAAVSNDDDDESDYDDSNEAIKDASNI